ncbi:GlsB/YeaQ/YmgE family stress response membrane protein [Pseudolabrys taiwanensis]|uniref:GlsB/YeaQ/YmgE family stress response membrane protein n=1 Tax=Pseudolabrys taiwanensis TaxID=331696 RepID=A0A345ZQB1_9HYPH|nr:GlsB/YeaQ/YmgE family stress response membrane protein [Pseudolabrys taiwanensis]AXK79108.1 GlsB/YeaQ/YmgE family stress response membrane protein [Pseudolabrys taiwanensis]
MTLVDIIIWLIIGGVAGWLAGLIVKGFGFGILGNIVVGIVGAIIAGWLLPRLGILIGGGVIAAIINAVIGAVILLLIIGLIRRA